MGNMRGLAERKLKEGGVNALGYIQAAETVLGMDNCGMWTEERGVCRFSKCLLERGVILNTHTYTHTLIKTHHPRVTQGREIKGARGWPHAVLSG